jgi:hypothetical protein
MGGREQLSLRTALDPDDVSTQVAQDARAQRPAQIGQIDDPHP